MPPTYPLPVRLTHFLNILTLFVLIGSGLAIFNAHPTLYAADSSDPRHVVLALAQTQESNQHLLEGVMALGRAALADEQGGKVQFELQGAYACLVDASGPPFCVRPGNGYLLMGAPEAMTAYQAKLGAPAQAAGSRSASGSGSASVMSDLMLLRARISMHEQGSAELVLHGRQTLTLEASPQTQSPVLLARAEQAVTQGDMLMKAGAMVVHYAQGAMDSGGGGGAAAAGASGIERIDVSNKVYVESKNQVATGDTGSFDMASQVMTLSGGEVVLTDGGSTIKGCKLTVQMKTGQARFEPCGGERVLRASRPR